jgi:hypothetical protein
MQVPLLCDEDHLFGEGVFEVFEGVGKVFAGDDVDNGFCVDNGGAVPAYFLYVGQHIGVPEVAALDVHVERNVVRPRDLALSEVVHQLHFPLHDKVNFLPKCKASPLQRNSSASVWAGSASKIGLSFAGET